MTGYQADLVWPGLAHDRASGGVHGLADLAEVRVAGEQAAREQLAVA